MPPKSRKRRSLERSSTKPKQSKETSGEAAPEVYTVIPPQSKKKKKPGQLTAKQLRQYFEEGFLPLPKFFSSEELDPVREAVSDEVERIAQMLFDGGKITDKHEDADLFHRLTLLEKDFPGTSVLLHKSENLPKAFKDLWSNERVLNMMEQLVGPEIAGNPSWNLRCKTPHNESAVVPWHQDNAYFDDTSLYKLVPTIWVPLLDVNKQNGCLQFARGGHCKGVTATHTCCAGGTWYVDMSEEEMEKTIGVDFSKDIVTCEFDYGGLVLFSNCIPHRSLENHSDQIRWALDLRYQAADKPAGLWGIKECVLLRSRKDKNLKINWEDFEKIDRTKGQEAALKTQEQADKGAVKTDCSSEASEDDGRFDTTLTGPWMHKWEVVHHNKHTATMEPTDGDTIKGTQSEFWKFVQTS